MRRLQEEMFVTQLLGFTVISEEEKVLRLSKVLYNLRQAPRPWYAKLGTDLL
jgi:hypothetical protein